MEIEKFRERIIANIPDYMRGQSDEVQAYYVEYEATKLMWETDPNRYYRFTNKRGEECEADLNSVAIKMQVKRLGGTDEQSEEAQTLRNKYALPINRKLATYKQKIKGLFGTKYSVAIVENADEIIDLFAQFYTVEDIIKLMKVKKGYTIAPTLLRVFYQDNRETIERRKIQFVGSKKDFFVATESGRLQVLNELLMTWRLKFGQEEKITYSAEIRKILEQARKECKGEQLFLTVDGKIDIEAMVHGQDNVSQSLQKLPINMIVIGLVAAKAGLNPATIIGQLASSYYKDHNGFNMAFLDGQDIQLPGDIIRNMAWDELKKKSAAWKENISPIEDAVVIQEEEKVEVENKRQLLLNLLKKKPDITMEEEKKERPIKTLKDISDEKITGYSKKDKDILDLSDDIKRQKRNEYHRRYQAKKKEQAKKKGKDKNKGKE